MGSVPALRSDLRGIPQTTIHGFFPSLHLLVVGTSIPSPRREKNKGQLESHCPAGIPLIHAYESPTKSWGRFHGIYSWLLWPWCFLSRLSVPLSHNQKHEVASGSVFSLD